ncbi:MAG: SM-20-related protein [Acidobacteriota bacterium]|jgi:SM-20-related protein|nr:SM-20-related protein [Acidobacteriota bacterium]
MITQESIARFDLLLEREFFDARTCEQMLFEMRSARGGPATVYMDTASSYVDESVRKATRITPSRETAEFVRRRLLEHKPAVEEHFRTSLGQCEEPQFLRYGVGGYFVAHQDGNTGMLRSEQEARRVSVVVFLNRQTGTPEPGAYCGGSLIFHPSGASLERDCLRMGGETGALVAFRAETTHEVSPVTHGERHSIVCWYR